MVKWARAMPEKCSRKAMFTAAPPAAPTTGAAWAESFSATGPPKRAAMVPMKPGSMAPSPRPTAPFKASVRAMRSTK
jgi:hypothetical protein